MEINLLYFNINDDSFKDGIKAQVHIRYRFQHSFITLFIGHCILINLITIHHKTDFIYMFDC